MIEILTIKEKIALTIDSTSGNNPIALFNYIPDAKPGYRIINEYLEINNLKAVSRIYNLDVIPFPVFELEDTESKQLLTAINLEWQSPRIEFDVLLKITTSGDWTRISSYSLLNQSPYPYREYSLGNHLLGNNGALGIRLRDVGYGSLQTTPGKQDSLVIFGDLTREVYLERIVGNSVKIANTINTSVNLIVNSNLERKGLSFANTSSKTVFIDTVSSLTTTSWLVQLDPGDYYEVPPPVYTGDYYAIVASGIAAIDIREFV